MSKKKKRSGGQKPKQTQPVPAEPQELDEEAKAARRAQQKAEWAAQKKKEDREPLPVATFAWIGGLVAVVAVVIVGGYMLLSGGSDSGGSAGPTSTPDPRVAGLPIAKSETVEADDDGQSVNPRFNPSTITANAGEVLEIRFTNVGSVAHNLRVSGDNKEYDPDAPTSDDFATEALQSGEETTLLVKIDAAGSYPFRCDLHPLQQIGALILN